MSTEELTVACVYWKGPFRGRENCYTEDWVARLKGMVSRNLSKPHRFVCLSNVDVPCERIPLRYDKTWIGWWSKLELFRPGLFKGRTLYLDLDLVILRSILPFFQFKSPMATLPAFGGANKEKGTRHGFNSSVIAFDPGEGYLLYETFRNNPERMMSMFRGDQDFIQAFGGSCVDTFPKEWVTKLRYMKDKTVADPTAKIVLCMPGKNQDAVEKYPWVKKIWRA